MSEPERPSVVVSPDGVRPMKPVTTGTIPFPSRAPSVRRARGSVFLRSHVAAPCRSSVTRNVRASTARAGTPMAERAAATSGAERRSPKDATRSVTRGVRSRRSEIPERAVSSSASGRGVEGDGGAGRGGDAGRGGLVAGAQLGDGLAGRAEAAPLGLVRGREEEVGDPSHRRGDGDDAAPPRGGGEEPGGVDDPRGVAERGPPELVDDDGAFTHFRRGALFSISSSGGSERLPAPRPDVAEDVADTGLLHAERRADLAPRQAREAPGEPDGGDLRLVGARAREVAARRRRSGRRRPPSPAARSTAPRVSRSPGAGRRGGAGGPDGRTPGSRRRAGRRPARGAGGSPACPTRAGGTAPARAAGPGRGGGGWRRR